MKCIYAIVNLLDAKKYIGSTSNYARRKKDHIKSLNNNLHHSIHLQLSWNKYSESDFVFIILEKLDKEELKLEREQYWIDYYKSSDRDFGYNMAKFAGLFSIAPRKVYKYDYNGNLIDIFEDCISAAFSVNCDNSGLSKCARGKYRYYAGYIWLYEEDVNEENIKKRIYLANNKPSFSLERREKIRQSRLGKKNSPESIAKQKATMKGKSPKNLDSIQKARRVKVYVYTTNDELVEEFESVAQCCKKYPSCGAYLDTNKKLKGLLFTRIKKQ